MKNREFKMLVKRVDEMYDKVHDDNLQKLKKIENYLNNEIRKDKDYFLPK